jgi:hypothetical protein
MSSETRFDGGIRRNDRAYRRGLILGLTMAEVVVLIIFALLLALATLIAVKEKRITQLTQELNAKNETIVQLKQRVKYLTRDAGNNDYDDLFRDLEVAQKRAARADLLEQKFTGLQERSKTLEEIEKALSENPLQLAGTLENQLVEILQEAQRARELSEVLTEHGLPDKDLRRLEKELASLATISEKFANLQIGRMHSEIRDLRKQLDQRQERIDEMSKESAGIGKGTEMPACWSNKATSKPEYIFDIALTSSGLLVRDRALPHRAAEQETLPLDKIIFGKLLKPRKFLQAGRAIFRWSVKHDCRFFVRAFDLTLANEKTIYKRQLRVLEQLFYKYEVLDEAFE